jgi:hypothetical protein
MAKDYELKRSGHHPLASIVLAMALQATGRKHANIPLAVMTFTR